MILKPLKKDLISLVSVVIPKERCIVINKKIKVLLLSVVAILILIIIRIIYCSVANVRIQPFVLYVDTTGYPEQMNSCLFETDDKGVLTIKIKTDGDTFSKNNLSTDYKAVQIVEQINLSYETCKKINKLIEDIKINSFTPQEINEDLYTDTLWIKMYINDNEYIDTFHGTLFLKQDPKKATAIQELTYTLLDQCSEQIHMKRFLHVIRVRKGE